MLMTQKRSLLLRFFPLFFAPVDVGDHCRKKGHSAAIDDIFDCVTRQIEAFGRLLKSNGVLEDTVLVISGDHPFMGPKKLKISLSGRGDEKQKSTDYFAVHLPDGRQLYISYMNHFSMCPTALSTLGVQVTDGAAGLGRDLHGSHSLSAGDEYAEFKRALRVKSAAYAGLWR